MKTTITLNKRFELSKEEITAFEALPDNMPETKLTKRQIDLVDSLYYKYISPIDNARWGRPLVDIEASEKWPSGSRMKRHEAKRICLNALITMNDSKKMTASKAASFFFSALNCRESWQRIIEHVFEVKTV